MNPQTDTNIDHRSDIRELQYYLRKIALQDNRIPLTAIDGIYGDETENAVRKFQRNYGLIPSGEVDYETWREIVRRARLFDYEIGPYFPIVAFKKRERVGKDIDILFLQVMIKALSRVYYNINDVEITGVLDEKTMEAIATISSISYGIGNIEEKKNSQSLEKAVVDSVTNLFNSINR